MNTTLIKKQPEMYHGPLPNCHGGIGALEYTVVLDGKDLPGRRLNFLHDDILVPGVTIGEHTHEDDEEDYYVLAGHGVMMLDGRRFDVAPGDITAVYPGGSHSVANTGDEDMHIIVVSVS